MARDQARSRPAVSVRGTVLYAFVHHSWQIV